MKPRDPAPQGQSVDVIDCIDFAYKALWRERHYLSLLAVVPVVVKLACFFVLLLLGWQDDFIRSGLVLLPSYFTEGWMLAHIIRLVFYDQRWPFRASGDSTADQAMLMDRAYGITAGALFYVVIKFLLSGFKAILNSAQISSVEHLPVQGEPPPGAVLVALLLVFITLWGFRFVFLYIPAAAGVAGGFMIRHRRGFTLSLQLLGVWLVSTVPVILILLLLSSGLLVPHLAEDSTLPLASRIVLVILQVVADTFVALISTLAATYGIKKMLVPPLRSV